MANDMVAFAASKLPAHLAGKVKTDNVFANAVSAGGFPVISIKGKVFHIQRGDEKTLVTKGEEGEPAASLEAIIVAVNPNKSKVYYDHGYEEGSVAKPTCYSNDGLAPAADAENPQAKKCAACPHNQWGSRITDNGGKGKACGDSMRLAIAPPDQLNDPMLIRVPAASLKTLGQYGAQLAKRGVEPHHVLTKIGFDYNVAHPALTFKAMRFVEAEELAQVEAVLLEEAETIGQITGTSNPVMPEVEHKSADPTPEPKAAKPTPEPKAAKPEPEKEAEGVDASEPAKATAKVDDYDSIDEALDNLDFDD
jgi:hypothetical protein